MKRANNSPFGLGAGVVSEDPSEIQYFIDNFKAGTVFANCYNAQSVYAPFGGYKDSGIGREHAEEAVSNYLETKTVIMKK